MGYLGGLILFTFTFASVVHAQTPYYQGKTVRLIVSSTAGSNYDLNGRLMAQYIGKHIPGKPEVVVQNMPGGGNIIGANYLYQRREARRFELRHHQCGALFQSTRREQRCPVRLVKIYLCRQPGSLGRHDVSAQRCAIQDHGGHA